MRSIDEEDLPPLEKARRRRLLLTGRAWCAGPFSYAYASSPHDRAALRLDDDHSVALPHTSNCIYHSILYPTAWAYQFSF
jgi:hypothetical protein